ncbi:DUF4270 family protein [Pontibacter chinhatensis]|uniref:DUF4270 domain-containing protein n=1 Tax=Pontibacter chinhatensis TaxID=1436961 RepID=A0A1I2VTU5_9BACT|nr:DUF4270 family protein [Pontibacter chinhatensis]SFG92572.1 protein of unknown function [Pontibacter chinhatensis]
MQFPTKKSLFRKKFNHLLYCLGAVLLLASCEDPNELGLELVEDNVSGTFVDTLTLNLTTVKADSIATSGRGSMIVGQYTTPQTGTLRASTYFQVGPSALPTLNAEAAYDSIKLHLPTSGYYYGDTTQSLTLSIHELTSALTARALPPTVPQEEPNSYFYQNAALYNTTKATLQPEPLATYTFAPRPVRKDTLNIDMSDDLGKRWFDLHKAGDEKIKDVANFVAYFKGLAITSTAGNAVIGFPTSGAIVRLYFSEPSASGGARTVKTMDFPLANAPLQYNRYEGDYTGTPLEGLQNAKELPASQAGEIAVAQSGTGLFIRIDIPHLDKLREIVRPELINKATLVVEPFRGASTTYPFPVPASMGLYQTAGNNVQYSPLPMEYPDPRSPQLLTSNFIKSSETATDGRYEFSITEYLINRLKDGRTLDKPLFLAPTAAEVQGGVSRLVVGAPNSAIKSVRLRIYYTTIQ